MAAYASTFKNLQDMVIAKLRLDPVADLTNVKAWINQALADVAIQSKWFSGTTAGTALTANATNQALPTNIIELGYITCSYGGVSPLLSLVTFDKILELRGLTVGAAGPPLFYSLDKNTVEFWPQAIGSEVLTYYGDVLPDALSGDSDTPGISEPFASELLTYGACVQASEFKTHPLMATYQAQYAAWMNKFVAFVLERQGSGPRRLGIRGAGSMGGGWGDVPHAPSSDWPGWYGA